jgi:hypothetical protein
VTWSPMRAVPRADRGGPVLTKALAGCASRIRRVEVVGAKAEGGGICPHFAIDGARVECPFHRGLQVWRARRMFGACRLPS